MNGGIGAAVVYPASPPFLKYLVAVGYAEFPEYFRGEGRAYIIGHKTFSGSPHGVIIDACQSVNTAHSFYYLLVAVYLQVRGKVEKIVVLFRAVIK